MQRHSKSVLFLCLTIPDTPENVPGYSMSMSGTLGGFPLLKSHDILCSREASLFSTEMVGKQKREQRFMQGIIASQQQSILEHNCLWLYFSRPKVHWNHLTFAKSQVCLVFLCAGKIVILRKYKLIETETLCGIVLISTRFSRDNFTFPNLTA